jgi:superfamily I DNA and/or RNA helicase
MCKQAAELGLDKSLFERYYKTGKVVQLDMQYRMVRMFMDEREIAR